MTQLSRRDLLAAGAAAITTAAAAVPALAAQGAPSAGRIVKKGRLKQTVCRWCYQRIPMADFCRAVTDMGLTAIDLLQPNEWEQLAPYGLICSMGYAPAGSIPIGFNNPANHETIAKGLETNLPLAAKYKV